jgi:hypothetical protein
MDMNPCNYFLQHYLKDCVYRTIPHAAQELQAETEETAGDMLCDTDDNSVDSFTASP